MSPSSRRARHRVVVVLAVAATLVGGCTPSAAPSDTPSDVAPPARSDRGSLAAFAATNGLDGLAATTVRVTAGATGTTRLQVDALVADTRATRARGLQQVPDVPAGVGMLFVFDGPAGPAGRPGFWMLDTLVPLDIVFATAAGDVVGTATMQPCTARPCPTTHPGVPYDVALEVAAGTLATAGVRSGDRLVLHAGPPDGSEDGPIGGADGG